ncbi:MAG: hypothetical protein M3R09_02940 [Actinomycetota bacterium]|nr:hypothetical protein [Actinomycetota bacterium]
MKIRSDVAELLRAGLADRVIARQLHVDAATTVAPTRAALGLPKHKPGPTPAPTVDAFVQAHCQALPGGHIRWTGYVTSRGIPQIKYGTHKRESVYRYAFRQRTGRTPVGYAKPACGMPMCVAPGHIDDQPMRDHHRATYTALFGGAQ